MPWIIHDRVRVRTDLDQEANASLKGFVSFTAMAAAEQLPFLNVRNASQADEQYCNVESTDKIAWKYELESMGLRFVYPSPYNAELVVSSQAHAKVFQDVLPEHASVRFTIRQDDMTLTVPAFMPAGAGRSGSIMYFSPANPVYADSLSEGVPDIRNRHKWPEFHIVIPNNTPIKGLVKFSSYGKRLLTAMVAPLPFDFNEGPNGEVPSEAFIEMSMRGWRFVQQIGDWYY